MRNLWLRITAAGVVVFGVVVAMVLPTSCSRTVTATYVGLERCSPPTLLRVIVIGASILVGLVLVALSTRPQDALPRRTPASAG